MVAPTIRFVIGGSIISGATKWRQTLAAFQKRFHHLRFCGTRAESRWLAQRKFRLFTTATAVAERPLVIGFAGGKSNDQRDRVDSSLRSKKRNQPQDKPAALAIKKTPLSVK
jgi:hypothetical protein